MKTNATNLIALALLSFFTFISGKTIAQDITYADGSAFKTTYCYFDSSYEIKGTPSGGTFSGCGVTQTNNKWYFNPTVAASGSTAFPFQCNFIYTAPGNVVVNKSVTVWTPVAVRISTHLSDSITCTGDVILAAIASFGAFYSYQWKPASIITPVGLNGNNTLIEAHITATTIFTLISTDNNSGCKDSTTQKIVKLPEHNFKVTPNAAIITTGQTINLQTSADSTYTITDWQPHTLFSDTSAINQAVALNTSAAITVTAKFKNGCRETDTSRITVFPTAVHGINKSTNEVAVYPNPAKDYIYIDVAIHVDASIVAADGRVVLQQKDARQISLSSLADGTYTIRITAKDGQVLRTEKIIKASR